MSDRGISRITAIIALMSIALATVTVSLGATPAVQDDEAVLRHLKEVLWPRAYREQDTALLDSILAEEFRLIDATGNWSTKTDELDYISHNAPTYDSLVFKIKRLDVFENGTAIVAGQGDVRGQDDEGAYRMTYQSTNVLIKRGNSWKAVASHVSGIKRETIERMD